jgi:hypothetical protein
MATTKVQYPADLSVAYPEKSSRVLALFGVLAPIKIMLLIPHLIIVVALAFIQGIVIYIGYWAVLIIGRYPRGLFNFGVGMSRWMFRIEAWLNGWVDTYPPFRLRS